MHTHSRTAPIQQDRLQPADRNNNSHNRIRHWRAAISLKMPLSSLHGGHASMAGFYGTALEGIGRAVHAIVINTVIHGNRLILLCYKVRRATHDADSP